MTEVTEIMNNINNCLLIYIALLQEETVKPKYCVI